MVKLKYNKWEEMNVGTFKKLMEISSNKELDEVDTEIMLLAILCDCDEEDILNLPIPVYQELRRESQWIAGKPATKAFCPKHIKLENQYDVMYDMSKISTAQYIDFQSYLKLNDMNKYLSHILAIFLIPKGKKYGDVPAEVIIKDIDDNMNMIMAESMCFFFITEFLTLMQLILTSLEQRLKKQLKESKGTDRVKIMEKLGEIHSQINGIGCIL